MSGWHLPFIPFIQTSLPLVDLPQLFKGYKTGTVDYSGVARLTIEANYGGLTRQPRPEAINPQYKELHMSSSLNSLKGGYIGDYIGDYYRGDYSSYGG